MKLSKSSSYRKRYIFFQRFWVIPFKRPDYAASRTCLGSCCSRGLVAILVRRGSSGFPKNSPTFLSKTLSLLITRKFIEKSVGNMYTGVSTDRGLTEVSVSRLFDNGTLVRPGQCPFN